jgi:Coenzyme PQQ synthesis protein D (PqqD)
MTALSAGAVVQRRSDLLANDLSATETVMLDVAGSSYYGLKDVGKVIWDSLESPISVDALCERLLTQFSVEPETCRRETAAFLEALHERGLIVVTR